MAKVFKRSGSNFYYGRFKLDGKQVWFSTKATDRKQAQAIADGKAKAARGKVNTDDYFTGLIALLARLPKADQDAKRNEYARRLMQGQSSTLALTEVWPVWLDSPLKGNPSSKTIAGYSAIWKRFAGWIGKQVDHVHEVTTLHAQDYAADVWRSKVSPATYNAHIKFLRSLFNMLKVKAGLIVNPWTDIRSLEKETQNRENFTPEELSAICSKATGATRYMIGIGLYTGMRLGDVVGLRWTNIGRDKIEIIPLKTRRKGKKLSMPIHPALKVLLAELKKKNRDSKYLFPDERAAYQKDTGAITKPFQQFLNDCGIATTEEGNGHRRRAIVRKGFHSLRHSFVSLCAANRVPQVAIQELVGHGSPAMTALYSHADFEQKQNAINGLPAMVFEKQKPDNKTKK